MSCSNNANSSARIRAYAREYTGKRLPINQSTDRLCISDNWDLVDCDNNIDIVFFYTSEVGYEATYKSIFKERIKRGFSCFIIRITGEATNSHAPGVDYSISFEPDSDNNYYFPMLIPIDEFHQLLTSKFPVSMQNYREQSKKYFCNFIYSNEGSKRFPGVKTRKSFCKLLSQYKQVDCAGHSLNNTDRLRVIEKSVGRSGETKLNFMKDYRFSVIFENQSVRGYITEKIWHAYLAGTIPIYWGSPNIARYFNPKSFINCHDYENFDRVIERVKEIDNDPELFNQYINANPIADDSEFHNFTYQKVSAQMDMVMQRVIKKREKWRSFKYPKLYEYLSWISFIALKPNSPLFVIKKLFGWEVK